MKSRVMCAVCAFAFAWPWSAAAQGSLERARVLYNEGQYEQAIAATAGARGTRAAMSAALIAARAKLELFRKGGDRARLASARAQLASLDPQDLAPQELVEWQIGLGSALFLENEPAAAAEIFSTVLPSARTRLNQAEFEKFLEWWGTATSQTAAMLTGEARTRQFERLRDDAARELGRNPLSRPAVYWLVVAEHGAGDLDGAWAAAVAGWIRAGAKPGGRQLRADLDAFITETLIPERSQRRTGSRPDARTSATDIATLTDEWRALTGRWGSRN
jgi:hypothetical protein